MTRSKIWIAKEITHHALQDEVPLRGFQPYSVCRYKPGSISYSAKYSLTFAPSGVRSNLNPAAEIGRNKWVTAEHSVKETNTPARPMDLNTATELASPLYYGKAGVIWGYID